MVTRIVSNVFQLAPRVHPKPKKAAAANQPRQPLVLRADSNDVNPAEAKLQATKSPRAQQTDIPCPYDLHESSRSNTLPSTTGSMSDCMHAVNHYHVEGFRQASRQEFREGGKFEK